MISLFLTSGCLGTALTDIHAHIHTQTAEPTTQGDSQLIRSN